MTSNFDLQKLARRNNLQVLIVTRQDLPYLRDRHRPQNENIIINLDIKGQTHWCALHVDEKVRKAWYYDSFGLEPPMNIIHYCKDLNLSINNIRIQSLNSVMCGQFCIYFLKEIQNHKNEKDIWKYIARKYDKDYLEKNDEIVKKLI